MTLLEWRNLLHQDTCWAADHSGEHQTVRFRTVMAELCPKAGGTDVLTYCVFCETAKCGFVAQAAELLFGCRAISPKMVQHTWSKGHKVDRVHDLLPGYVFLYVEGEPLDIPSVRAIHGVIRCLSTEGFGYVLQGNDEQMALMLLKKGGTIGKTQVYQDGDLFYLVQGAFDGAEASILKVDRRNSRMQVELQFLEKPVRTWLEYEVVDRPE